MAKSQHLEKSGSYKWIPLSLLRVSGLAQRELREYRVNDLLSEFDPEQIGVITVNLRTGEAHYHIIDGQHRTEALKRWLGTGWEGQHIYCHVLEGLTEQEEAQRFLRMNNQLTVGSFDKFKTAVTAGLQEETAIYRVVQSLGMNIGQTGSVGTISAVGSLRKVYRRSDKETLAKALRIIRDSFGDVGFSAAIIDGVGMVCQRYNGVLSEERAVECLGGIRGGVSGLLGKAHSEKARTHEPLSRCIAANIVDFINAGRGGKKLPTFRVLDQE